MLCKAALWPSHSLSFCHCRNKQRSLVAKANANAQLWQRPPADFDFRAESRPATVEFVKKHPELRPLLDQGALLVVPRPADYIERRTDGYQEPEEVVLVGTAHVSEQSAKAVSQVIEAARPGNVVVELCRSRSSIMQDNAAPSDESAPIQEEDRRQSNKMASSNPLGLSGGSLPEALWRSVRLGGGTQVVLRALMANQAAKVANSVGLATGGEMRAARQAAERVGAVIVLGDRPIEVTLQRAWRALTWRQKLQLGQAMLNAASTRVNVDAQTVEQLKSDDSMAKFQATLSEQFPQIAAPLLHERDAYLAWCLKRSRAVSGAKRVVGVVGFGHLRGVTWHLLQDSSQLRFRDLAGLTGSAQQEQTREGKTVELLLTGAGIASSVWWVSTLLPHR